MPQFPGAVEVEVLVIQPCPTLCKTMYLASQAPLSMGFSRQEYWSGLPFLSSWLRDQTQVSQIAGEFFTVWATREAQEYWSG